MSLRLKILIILPLAVAIFGAVGYRLFFVFHFNSICLETYRSDFKAPEGFEYLAHAGGEIDGKTYTDSLEALNSSYKKGFRVFEIDLRLTRDSQVIALHDWSKVFLRDFNFELSESTRPMLHELLRARRGNEYTIITLPILKEWMQSHQDAKIILDIKQSHEYILRAVAVVLSAYKDRIYPEVFSIEQYDFSKKMGINHPMPSFYGWGNNWNKMIPFLIKERPFAVVMPFYEAYRYQNACKLFKAKIPVFVHTVETAGEKAYFKRRGAVGFYVDRLIK